MHASLATRARAYFAPHPTSGKATTANGYEFSAAEGAKSVEFDSSASFCHGTVSVDPMVNPMAIVRGNVRQ